MAVKLCDIGEGCLCGAAGVPSMAVAVTIKEDAEIHRALHTAFFNAIDAVEPLVYVRYPRHAQNAPFPQFTSPESVVLRI